MIFFFHSQIYGDYKRAGPIPLVEEKLFTNLRKIILNLLTFLVDFHMFFHNLNDSPPPTLHEIFDSHLSSPSPQQKIENLNLFVLFAARYY